jgi:hypothetical protein
MAYRYHFVAPVKGHEYVDRPDGPPIPSTSHGTYPLGFEANVPKGSSQPPVFIPWTNIAYVERVRG